MSDTNRLSELRPNVDPSILRALDANLNRAGEAIRVVEDCFRFVMDDAFLTRKAKELRHALASVAEEFTSSTSCGRDVAGDVGRHAKTTSEYSRSGLRAILAANFKRAQQSLRSLEEFSKILDEKSASRFETIRYDVYALQHSIDATCEGQDRLRDTRLYVLVNGCASDSEFASLVDGLLAADVDAIQLRDKELTDRELLSRARMLVEAVRGRTVLAFVNDRVDLPAIARVDGVHLGQEDLPVAKARSILKPNQLIGVSTHTLEQARQAVSHGANYIGVGPVFASPTKQFEEFIGPELLRQVSREVSLPAFAIGGITTANVDLVTGAGIKRIAVQSGLLSHAREVVGTARQFQQALADPCPVSD